MSFVNRKLVLMHIFVIIGVSLAGFCGHGSWGHEAHDYSPFRSQRATHGGSPYEMRKPADIQPSYDERKPDDLTPSYDTRRTAKSTTTRAVTDDDIPQDHLTNILKDHEIIPDIIDSAPHVVQLEVTYDGGAIVNNGDELTVEETADKPIQINWDADENSYYTLLLVGNLFKIGCICFY